MDYLTSIVLIILLFLLVLLIVYAFRTKKSLPGHIEKRWAAIKKAILSIFKPKGPTKTASKSAPKSPPKHVPKPPTKPPPIPIHLPPPRKFEIEDVILDDFEENESAYVFELILNLNKQTNEETDNLFASLKANSNSVKIKPAHPEPEHPEYVELKNADANKYKCEPFVIKVFKTEEEKDKKFYDKLEFKLDILQKIA